MDYAKTIKSSEPNELQAQLDEAVKDGYRPVANMFVFGVDLCIFMAQSKAQGPQRSYLIGAGRRIEEVTHWVNIEHRNGWRVIDGFRPVEFNNFMYVLVSK